MGEEVIFGLQIYFLIFVFTSEGVLRTKPLLMYDNDGFFDIFSPAVLIFCLAIAVFIIAAMWKVFVKAGQPGWAAIIPIYNLYIITKIAGKPGWWVLLLLIPLVNYVFIVWLYNMVSKSFGKDEGFTVGLVLLGIVFWPILGFGGAKYQGPFGDPVAFRAYQDQHQFDFEKKA